MMVCAKARLLSRLSRLVERATPPTWHLSPVTFSRRRYAPLPDERKARARKIFSLALLFLFSMSTKCVIVGNCVCTMERLHFLRQEKAEEMSKGEEEEGRESFLDS